MAKAVNMLKREKASTVVPAAVAGVQIQSGPAPLRKQGGRGATYEAYLVAARRMKTGEWIGIQEPKTSTLVTLKKLLKKNGIKNVDVYKATDGGVVMLARGEDDFLED